MEKSSDRQLRVFLSSTFTDMQEERDALVKLFRELTNEGHRRGVDIKLVDLRWGVTDDQRRTGRVISTCLEEIDNSRPFFIGLLGDRYGWIPTAEELKINPELRERYPIVDKYCSDRLSMTEIEMRYGVLDAEPKDDSIFLIKRNARFESDRHRQLLEELTSGKVTYDYYESVEDLTEKIRRSMIDLLDRRFPLLSDIPVWQQYENIHENIAKRHRGGYIPYSDYLERLDKWLRSDSQHIVVTGEPGSGKSSLISEWLCRNDFDGYRVIYHFIGSGLAEGSHLEVQRHFLTRLEHEYGLEPTPEKQMLSDDDDYSLELEKALRETERRGDKWLLIVDGLDHLQQSVLAKLMIWFPELPSSAKALFSTIPTDMTYQRLCEALGYDELTLTPLSKEFTVDIVNDYLANVGKSLDPSLTDMIASNALFSNPYLLRMLLDELVTYGVHEQIGAHIFNFTTSKDKSDFYGKLINHAEEYYGQQRVKDIMTLIACTKNGLSETSVIEILGLDPVDWAMAYAGLQRMFTFINGKNLITNMDIHEALNSYYNYEENDYQTLTDYRRRILEYLEKEGNDIDELAYLYWCTGDVEKLYTFILNPEKAITLIQHGDKLFASYWTSIMEETNHTPYDYLNVEFHDNPDMDTDEQIDYLSYILSLQFADNELSFRLKEKSNQLLIASGKDDHATQYMIASNYLSMAQDLLDLGKIEEAENMIEKVEQAFASLGEKDYSEVYLTRGNIATAVGDYEEALEMNLKAIKAAEEADGEVTWKYLNNAGLAYFNMNLPEDAKHMFTLALEKIKKDMIAETPEGAIVMQNLGLSYYSTGETDKAENLYKKALDIYSFNLETPGINVALILNNLGLIYRDRDEDDEAMEYFM
ncbi:MAG: tetratricopeptide repeat protein, partial [Muribaculaceae bacterium]|nr:tetratricopeptide repeat protein [Muribaculaceae bacterium]